MSFSPIRTIYPTTGAVGPDDLQDLYADLAIGPIPSALGTEDEVPVHNGSADPTAVVGSTGNQGIDGLLGGVKWSDGFITYSFPSLTSQYQSGYPESLTNFQQLNAAQQMAVHFALNSAIYTQPSGASGFSVEGFTNLTIDLTSGGSGTIRLANTSDPATAYAYYPSTSTSGGDAFFGGSGRTPVMGNYHWHTILHELGHSLGLKHGQDGGNYGAMPSGLDAMEYSIMTYRSYVGGPTTGYTNETYGYAQTYMMYDIAALQYMYGADFTSNSGNTVYRWDPSTGNTYVNGAAAITPGGNRIFMTIWDGNGTDTYDLSAYTTGVSVNLSPGSTSLLSTTQQAYLGNGFYASGNVYNALLYNGDTRSLIENAIGGSGNDTLIGNQANNTLTGNAGADRMEGGTGNDTLIGGANVDMLYGGADADYLIGSVGGDVDSVLDGGTGQDTLSMSNLNTGYVFDFELGQTRTMSGVIVGSLSGIEVFFGGLGDDVIVSDGNANSYYGGAGNDTLVAELGAETLDGGSGIDRIDTTRWNGDYVIDLATGSSNYGGELFLNFEWVLLGAGNDSVTGTSVANCLDGGAGNDALRGYGGSDSLIGGAGSDTLVGGTGDDVYSTDGTDVLIELAGEGNDQVRSFVDFTLAVNFERLVLMGSALRGTGNAGANRITGTDAANWLDGAGGADTLVGGRGNDTYVTNGGDLIAEYAGGGSDTVRSSVSYSLGGYLENLLLTGSGNTSGIGNALSNRITGSTGANSLNGGAGNDTIMGGQGNDTLRGQDGADRLDGGLRNDVLQGGAGADTLIFRSGADRITDFANNVDTIAIDDALWGGAVRTVAQLVAMAQMIGNDVYFSFGGGNSLLVENIGSKAQLLDDLVIV